MTENILIYGILACIFFLMFASRRNSVKRNSVIGADVKRDSDAVIEAVAGKFILKEK